MAYSASGNDATHAPSRKGSMPSPRPRNRAGARQASDSGGVVGLPGSIEQDTLYNTYKPALSGSDDFLGLDLYDFSNFEDFDMSQFSTIEDPLQQPQQPQRGGSLGFSSIQTQQIVGNSLGYSSIQTQQVGGNDLGISPTYSIQIPPTMPKSMVDNANASSNAVVPIDPALEDWDPNTNTTPLSPFWGITPGLSALPQGTDYTQPELPAQPTHIYPDPDSYTLYPTGPYYRPQIYNGYVPMQYEQPVASGSYIQSWGQTSVSTVQKRKRSGSVSDDEAPLIKRTRPVEGKHTPPAISSRRPSTSSITKPVKTAVVKPGQKPKKVEEKSWVRINTSTRGETTRTARINQYTEEGDKYKMMDLPHGDWESTNYKFEYTQIGHMHEFKKRTMSARQIHEYITQYPGDLRIWIQPVASDSARRYNSATQNHCRFEKCPMRKYTGKGTTEVGNYRVAFDEKHMMYGKGVADPYDCVGYAHLYCMERFLDFAYICQVANVKVDERVSLAAEPKGVFAAAFGHKHYNEVAVASTFIKACKNGRLSETRDFKNYPVHEHYAHGEPKPHELTLVYALYEMNIEHRAPSQMKQFVCQRTIRPGSFTIHRGDIEVKLVDKKIEKLDAFREWVGGGLSKKDFDYSAYYDYFHPEIDIRIREMQARRDEMEAIAAGRGKKRRAAPIVEDEHSAPALKRVKHSHKRVKADDSDSSGDEAPPPQRPSTKWKRYQDRYSSSSEEGNEYEEIGTATQPQHGTRSSPRKVQRINYTEPQEITALPSPPPHPHAAYRPAQPIIYTQQPPDTRRGSLSHLFPSDGIDWDNFDLSNLPEFDNAEPLSQSQIDALLQRRKSSTMSVGPRGWRKPRTASFNAQPVSSSMKFRRNDPPSRVKSAADVRRDAAMKTRRGSRLAGKAK
ncbi:hypothetical protein PtrSN002B_000375 [Pyrenophora tritici-repentis]|uniref:Uncharacterized protein n=1 Tax=Pyrenophora tritici-repentis TaxID=45151 RepID=A0A2W1HHQ5_9PLEO|nr:hypothetical protein A1F99_048280 [Pyrenophora tritici-repentis]KAF7572786.1 hypothetical protein PtrM4_076910 [Pyrenophora tritici-repentis]KAG9376179.1 hypothetical protein A1F94_013445 [Pyrenophora tritici-repentis]KAI0592080.1 hypothetical protein Alg130_00681 [Pyrenophora tritici-repentis]KAI0614250.1 hypothetical protein TUN205_01543 [Pyrenophora tritici-repentis]